MSHQPQAQNAQGANAGPSRTYMTRRSQAHLLTAVVPQQPSLNVSIQGTRGRRKSVAAIPQPVIYSVPDVIPSLNDISTNYEEVIDVVNDDKTIDFSRAIAMVVVRSQGSKYQYVSTDRIRVYDRYQARLAHHCAEGRRGQEFGSAIVPAHYATPGIPDRKFSYNDVQTYGTNTDEWDIQDIMINPHHREQFMANYLGWTSYNNEYMLVSGIEGTDLKESCELREKFLMKLGENTKLMPWIERELFPEQDVVDDVEHSLWHYKDLTFYHSQLHADYGFGPVFYFSLRKEQASPPKFAYSMVNVLHEDAYLRCLGQKANETIGNVEPDVVPSGDNVGACENPAGCKCNYRAKTVYDADENGEKGVVLLHHDQHGILNIDKFDYDKANVVVECSDSCGCSDSCPRRTLQSLKAPPVAVMHHEKMGFCAHAMQDLKKGSCIAEYVGEVMLTKPEMLPLKNQQIFKKAKSGNQANIPIQFRMSAELKEETKELHGDYERDYGVDEDVEFLPSGRTDEYTATFGVLDQQIIISAEKVGNVARFLAHSCNPNATFVETFSRRYEEDAYCPRIAVYALRDIEEGESITIRYYAGKDMKEKTSRKCFCRRGCRNYFPEIEDC